MQHLVALSITCLISGCTTTSCSKSAFSLSCQPLLDFYLWFSKCYFQAGNTITQTKALLRSSCFKGAGSNAVGVCVGGE